MTAEVQSAVEQIAKVVDRGVSDRDIKGLLVVAIDLNGKGRFLMAYEDDDRKEVIAQAALAQHSVLWEAMSAGVRVPAQQPAPMAVAVRPVDEGARLNGTGIKETE